MSKNKYLGEFDVDINETEFKDYTPADWAIYYITAYGSIDGEHHKTWVMDQVVRILKGTPVIVKEARWGEGYITEFTEYRVDLGEPSQEYHDWEKELREVDEDGEFLDDDDDFYGIAP